MPDIEADEEVLTLLRFKREQELKEALNAKLQLIELPPIGDIGPALIHGGSKTQISSKHTCVSLNDEAPIEHFEEVRSSEMELAGDSKLTFSDLLRELKDRQEKKAKADQDFLALLQMGNPDEEEEEAPSVDEPMCEMGAMEDAMESDS